VALKILFLINSLLRGKHFFFLLLLLNVILSKTLENEFLGELNKYICIYLLKKGNNFS